MDAERKICATCGVGLVLVEVDEASWYVHGDTGHRLSSNVEEHVAATFHHDPTARRRDPHTSHEAADSVDRIRAADLRDWIVDRLDHFGPETDQDLHAAAMWEFGDMVTPSGLRTRRSELVKEGRVEYAGRTATLQSGRQGRLWQAVSKTTLF